MSLPQETIDQLRAERECAESNYGNVKKMRDEIEELRALNANLNIENVVLRRRVESLEGIEVKRGDS